MRTNKLIVTVMLAAGLGVLAGGVVRVDTNGTGNGSSWALASSLSNALANAQGGDELWIAKGTYANNWDGTNSFRIVTNVTLYGGFTNGMGSLAERAWSNHTTILSGGNARRVVTVTATNVVLDGLTIRDGYLAAVVPATGIYKDTGGRLVLANCEIAGNRARQTSTTGHLLGGGGYFASCSVTITNCTFQNNGNSPDDTMRFCDGLAFYAANATVEVLNSRFYTNRANTAWSQRSNVGGAIHCSAGSLRVSDSTFVGNRGGCYDRGNPGGAGAVYLGGACTALFTNCLFRDNLAWDYPSDTTTPSPGGALWVAVSAVSTVSLVNCVLLENAASQYGGAFMVTSGNMDMRNCSVASNTAVSGGGGIYAKSVGRIDVQDSILWNNASTTGVKEIHLGEGVIAVDYTCLTGTDDGSVYGGVALSRVMTNPPLFASATDLHLKSTAGRWDPATGGWTNDAVNSPCIDAGNPVRDFSQEPAYHGGRINLGAYGNTAQASKSPAAAAPQVEDRGVSVSLNSATVTGELTVGTRSDIRVYYGTNATGLESQSAVNLYPPRDTGTVFSARLTGLLAATTYYYAFFATNGAGFDWSPVNSFVSGAEPPGGGTAIIHVDRDATGAETGRNWLDAFKTMAQGLAAAGSGRDEIWVAEGTYVQGTELVVATNLSLYGGFTGVETSRNARSLTNKPVLTGNNAHRVVSVVGTNVTIDGVTIRDGYLEGGTQASGLYKDSGGRFVLANCDVVQNAVYQNTSVDVLGCGAHFTGGSVLITNCTFMWNGQSAWLSREALRRCCGIGFYASGADVTVADSRFYTNTVRSGVFAPDNRGGGFHCRDGTLRVTGSTFADNKGSYMRYAAEGGGGGAGYLAGACAAEIRNCIFQSNATWPDATYRGDGGALWVGVAAASTVTVANCTFTTNTADWFGGAVFAISGNLQAKDSILWRNAAARSGSELYATNTATVAVSYSDLTGTNDPYVVAEGGATLTLGPGLLTADPLFVSATDLHLKSKAGRWDPAAGAWTNDAVDSPCIDAGDPASDRSNEPYPNGRRVNLGAYGNTVEASKSRVAGTVIVVW